MVATSTTAATPTARQRTNATSRRATPRSSRPSWVTRKPGLVIEALASRPGPRRVARTTTGLCDVELLGLAGVGARYGRRALVAHHVTVEQMHAPLGEPRGRGIVRDEHQARSRAALQTSQHLEHGSA